MTSPSILLGAVAYDPKVVPIWEGMRAHFRASGVDLDFALFSNYERQVETLLRGHIDIAWNTPLAHVRVKRNTDGASLSLGMRDSDRDFRSKLIVRKDSGIRSIADLSGRTLAVGSRDSTQARILPLHFLGEAGVKLTSLHFLPFDTDLGKHGDTGTSELDVLMALHEGRAEAGVVGDLIWALEQAAGRINGDVLEVLWSSPPFDHCMFDALPDLASSRISAFQTVLWDMDWDDPRHRPILEMEGLKKWMPPREEGYRSLIAALDVQGGW